MRQLWAAAACGASAGSGHRPRSPGKSCSRWQGAHLSGPQTGGGSGKSRRKPEPTAPVLSRIPIFWSFLSPSPKPKRPQLSASSQSPLGTSNRPHWPPYFMVGEGFTLLRHKAVQKRERDEAEEDDKEHGAADNSLGLWAAAQQQGGCRGKRTGGQRSLISASAVVT